MRSNSALCALSALSQVPPRRFPFIHCWMDLGNNSVVMNLLLSFLVQMKSDDSTLTPEEPSRGSNPRHISHRVIIYIAFAYVSWVLVPSFSIFGIGHTWSGGV